MVGPTLMKGTTTPIMLDMAVSLCLPNATASEPGLRPSPDIDKRGAAALLWGRQQIARYPGPELPGPHRDGDGESLSALSGLNAVDRCQDEPARKKPQQRRNNPRAEAWQHGALIGHEPAVSCLRNVRC